MTKQIKATVVSFMARPLPWQPSILTKAEKTPLGSPNIDCILTQTASLKRWRVSDPSVAVTALSDLPELSEQAKTGETEPTCGRLIPARVFMVSWWKSRDSVQINAMMSHHVVQHQHLIMQWLLSRCLTFTNIKESKTLNPSLPIRHVWPSMLAHRSLNTSRSADHYSITSCENSQQVKNASVTWWEDEWSMGKWATIEELCGTFNYYVQRLDSARNIRKCSQNSNSNVDQGLWTQFVLDTKPFPWKRDQKSNKWNRNVSDDQKYIN